MSRSASLRPAARRDLDRLAKFFADAPPEIAEQMTLLLEQRIDRLTRFPFMGRPYKERNELRETIVAFGRSRYVIRYAVTDDEIIVTRIWHSRENRPR